LLLNIRPLLALLVAAGASACTEDLDGSAACPALCPDQGIPVEEIELTTAITLDTTTQQYPTRGTEGIIPLISAGDTLDTRGVFRFDTVTRVLQASVAGSPQVPIQELDSAFVQLALLDTLAVRPASIIVEVFDVDTTAADTNFAAVAALFREDRRLGIDTLTAAEAQDSVRIFLDPARLLAKIGAGERIRLGVTARANGEGVFLQAQTVTSGRAAVLFYRARADTVVRLLSHAPQSLTPADEDAIRGDLADYTLYVKGTPPAGPDEFVVGGLPGHRVYLRFELPLWLTDSTTVVRATLLLTQRPGGGGFPLDTVNVVPNLVVAGPDVRDVARAADLYAEASALGVDSLRLEPDDSAEQSFEIAPLLRFWAGRPVDQLPRAVVLRTSDAFEGISPREARFFSLEAPAGVRPRLFVVYIPREPFGIP
jgi:hypothetical protein